MSNAEEGLAYFGRFGVDEGMLRAALDRALDAIGGGRQALLNVLCRGP